MLCNTGCIYNTGMSIYNRNHINKYLCMCPSDMSVPDHVRMAQVTTEHVV